MKSGLYLDVDRWTNAMRWSRYATRFQDEKDVYGTFFAAWISLVIIAAEVESHSPPRSQSSNRDGDRLMVQALFKECASSIHNAINEGSQFNVHRRFLAERHGGEILSDFPYKHHKLPKFEKLSNIWLTNINDLDGEQEGLCEVFLTVRNLLFHGGKIYNDPDIDRVNSDMELLGHLNPLLLAIVNGLLER